ncbi:hypothetical protein PCE1_001746 [Barthelona sp. PCE]
MSHRRQKSYDYDLDYDDYDDYYDSYDEHETQQPIPNDENDFFDDFPEDTPAATPSPSPTPSLMEEPAKPPQPKRVLKLVKKEAPTLTVEIDGRMMTISPSPSVFRAATSSVNKTEEEDELVIEKKVERTDSKHIRRTVDRLAERRSKSLTFVVLGHVDAGKSTLCGRLLDVLGAINERTLHRAQRRAEVLKMNSWDLAFLFDDDATEQEKGVTIYANHRTVSLRETPIVLCDCPGHRDFVGEAFRGAVVADSAVLVVDGSDPISEIVQFAKTGQLFEHLSVASFLGLMNENHPLIVAVNKLDREADMLSKFNEVKNALMHILKLNKNVRFVPIVARSNSVQAPHLNINAPSEDLGTSVTLLDQMEKNLVDKAPSRELLEQPPMVVVFSSGIVQGLGLVVHGRIVRGCLTTGDKLLVGHNAEAVTVKSIEVFGAMTTAAATGDFVKIRLAGHHNITPGDILMWEHDNETYDLIEGEFRLTPLFNPKRPLLLGEEIECCWCGEMITGIIRRIGTSDKEVHFLAQSIWHTIKHDPRITIEVVRRQPFRVVGERCLQAVALRLDGRAIGFMKIDTVGDDCKVFQGF